MRRGERGNAAIETALVLTLLLMIALGAYEWGSAFRDWLGVTAASREGARVGAAAGDQTGADCIILEAAAGAMLNVRTSDVVDVWVYKANPTTGAVLATNKYRPSQPSDDPSSLVCGTWFPIQTGWAVSSRDNKGEDRDWIGVRVEFDHTWQTGFLWFRGSVCDGGTSITNPCWKQDTIMHIEPDPTP